MKKFVYRDEAFVYDLLSYQTGLHRAMELTDEELADFNRVTNEFFEWQVKLAKIYYKYEGERDE